MTKSKIIFLGGTLSLVLIFCLLLFLQNYLALNVPAMVTTKPSSGQPSASTSSTLKLEVVADGLYVPWSIVFTSPSRMLVSERNGSIRVVENGQLASTPVITFPEIDSMGEEGLMGMVLDPDYIENRFFYVCLAYPDNNKMSAKVLRLTDHGTTANIDHVLLSGIPAAQFHAGCELGFGPDGKLYISTGDATDKQIAQDLNSLGGKILRLNADGSIPNDNPFSNSAVWSYGHRNPQGIDWHPVTNQLFSAEHGPSVFDGPAGGDEVNLITKGANYGWPKVSHDKSAPGMVDPLLVFTPAIAPGSVHFYNGDTIPEFKNNLLVAMLKGEGILRVILEAPDYTKVTSYQKLVDVEVGRIREITTGPDGAIYFTTSNRDGRGVAKDGDDKVYRLTNQN